MTDTIKVMSKACLARTGIMLDIASKLIVGKHPECKGLDIMLFEALEDGIIAYVDGIGTAFVSLDDILEKEKSL